MICDRFYFEMMRASIFFSHRITLSETSETKQGETS